MKNSCLNRNWFDENNFVKLEVGLMKIVSSEIRSWINENNTFKSYCYSAVACNNFGQIWGH